MISPDKNNIVGYFTITIKPITVNTDEFSNTVRRKIARVSEQNSDNGKYSLSAYLIAQLGKIMMIVLEIQFRETICFQLRLEK